MVHGLDGVDHHDRRLDLVDEVEDVGQRGLRRQPQAGAQRAEPLGAQAHLLLGLLGRDVEDLGAVGGDGGHRLQQQRGLADAGLAADQGDRAGHEAAARGRGRARRCRWLGPTTRRRRPRRSGRDGRAGRGARPRCALRARRAPRRGCSIPRSPGSGPPTWVRWRRTRCTGTPRGPWPCPQQYAAACDSGRPDRIGRTGSAAGGPAVSAAADRERIMRLVRSRRARMRRPTTAAVSTMSATTNIFQSRESRWLVLEDTSIGWGPDPRAPCTVSSGPGQIDGEGHVDHVLDRADPPRPRSWAPGPPIRRRRGPG